MLVRVLLVLAVASVIVTPLAVGADPSPAVTVSSSPGGTCQPGMTGVKITVDVPEGLLWKDLHFIRPDRKTVFPNPRNSGGGGSGATCSVNVGGQTWRAAKDTKGNLNIYTNGPGPNAAGHQGPSTHTFTLCFPTKAGQTLDGIPWKATNDGTHNAKYDNSDVIGSDSVDDEETPLPKLPRYKLSLANDIEQLTIQPGGNLVLTSFLADPVPGSQYEIAGSTMLDEEGLESPYTCIRSQSYPVPQAWGLMFENFTGLFQPEGYAIPEPTITASPTAPIGQSFYLVLIEKDALGAQIGSTHVVQVTIQ